MSQIIPSPVTLPPLEWIYAPQTRAVLEALGAGQALFVGGCVRNAVLGIPVSDMDLATVLPPETVMARLAAAGLRGIPTGIAHGTVTAMSGGRPYEITTLRKDVETDGRHAVVAFTQDWREDALRRDFTINTLLADAAGRVYDPLGTGLEDLAAGRVVFVGDPASRIAEDHLRILRFFRFYASYGQGAPDSSALAACKAAAESLDSISRERITQEFLKILMGPKVTQILDLMFSHDVLKVFHCQAYDSGLMARLCVAAGASLAARLVTLCGLREEGLAVLESRCILPKALKAQINGIFMVLGLSPFQTEKALKIAMYRQGREVVRQAFLIALACGGVAEEDWKNMSGLIENWEIPVFPVRGEDLLREGYETGPALGERLKALEEAWVDRGFVLFPSL